MLASNIHQTSVCVFFLVLWSMCFSASTLFAALDVLLDVSFIIEVYGENAYLGCGGNLDLQSWMLLCLFLWRSEGITCSDCTTGVKIKHILESIIRLKSDIWCVKRADWFPSNLYAQLETMKWWKNILSCLGTAWNVTYGCNLSNQMFWLLHYKTF